MVTVVVSTIFIDELGTILPPYSLKQPLWVFFIQIITTTPTQAAKTKTIVTAIEVGLASDLDVEFLLL